MLGFRGSPHSNVITQAAVTQHGRAHASSRSLRLFHLAVSKRRQAFSTSNIRSIFPLVLSASIQKSAYTDSC